MRGRAGTRPAPDGRDVGVRCAALVDALPRLLPIVATVAESEATGAALSAVSDLDPIDLYHALAVAAEAGLIRHVGAGRYGLTDRGVEWADLALEPLGHLVARVLHDRARTRLDLVGE